MSLAKHSQKNIMVLCFDTLRADVFYGEYEKTRNKFPNIEKIRNRGTNFINAFGEGLPTIPARRSFFTGVRSFPWRYSYETKGVWPSGKGWHQIPEEQETLAEIFLINGYETGLITDTYHMFKPTMNFSRGFSSYEFIRGSENDNFLNGKVTEEELAPFVKDTNLRKNASLAQYLANVKERNSSDDWNIFKVFNRSINWISRRNKEKPFFLWVDSYTPHEPWDPEEKYIRMHWNNSPETPKKKFIFPIGMKREDFDSEDEIEYTKALYFGFVSMVDEALGKLITYLEETNEIENTVIIVLSDHGTELMDHGQFSKSSNRLYTHNTRIVFSVIGSEFNKGYVDRLVQAHDLAPTLIDYLGKERMKTDGISLLPLLKGEQMRTRDFAIIGWGSNISIRNAQWNYFINVEDGSNEHLFDILNDPYEKSDLATTNKKMTDYFRRKAEEFLGSSIPYKFKEKVSDSIAPFRYYYGATSKDLLPDWDAGFG